MLFVALFVVALVAIPLSAERTLRGSDNVITRAKDQVDTYVKKLPERFAERGSSELVRRATGWLAVVLRLAMHILSILAGGR